MTAETLEFTLQVFIFALVVFALFAELCVRIRD